MYGTNVLTGSRNWQACPMQRESTGPRHGSQQWTKRHFEGHFTAILVLSTPCSICLPRDQISHGITTSSFFVSSMIPIHALRYHTGQTTYYLLICIVSYALPFSHGLQRYGTRLLGYGWDEGNGMDADRAEVILTAFDERWNAC